MRNSTLFAALALVATPALADREVSRPVSVKVPRGNVQRVIIDIPAGEIRIRNGDANTLAVDGVISHHDGSSRERSQKIVDDMDIEIVVNGDKAMIRRRIGPNARGWRARNFTAAELDLELPAGVDLDIGTKVGEVKIVGTFRNVAASLRAGEIDFRAPRDAVGELSASCRVGEVRADFVDRILNREGIFPGRTYFVNAQGKGRVNLHVTAGTVNVELTR